MLNLNRDIHSLTDFKRNTSDFVKQMKETKNPVVLTVNGKAELVVQDAQSYQVLLETIERIETIDGIRRGLEDLQQGRVRPVSEAFADLRKKYNLPNE
jgi:prevent-host-death family protein